MNYKNFNLNKLKTNMCIISRIKKIVKRNDYTEIYPEI